MKIRDSTHTHIYQTLPFGREYFCSQAYCCNKTFRITAQWQGMWRKPHILSFLILKDGGPASVISLMEIWCPLPLSSLENQTFDGHKWTILGFFADIYICIFLTQNLRAVPALYYICICTIRGTLRFGQQFRLLRQKSYEILNSISKQFLQFRQQFRLWRENHMKCWAQF